MQTKKGKAVNSALCASFFSLFAFALPLVAHAFFHYGFGTRPRHIGDVVDILLNIIGLIIPLLIALALVAFLWGVFRYVVATGGEDKKDAMKVIIWGIIGLFVMVSVWGLVRILTGTFGIWFGFPFLPTGGSGLPLGF